MAGDPLHRAPGTTTLSDFDGRKTLSQLEAEKAAAAEKEDRFARIPLLYPEVEKQYGAMLKSLSGEARTKTVRKLAEQLYDRKRTEGARTRPVAPPRPEIPPRASAPTPPEPHPTEEPIPVEPILEAEPFVEVVLDEEATAAVTEIPDSLRPAAWAEWGGTPLTSEVLARFNNAFVPELGKVVDSLTPEQLETVKGMYADIVYNMYVSAQTEEVDPKLLVEQFKRALPSYWNATLDSARLFAPHR